MALFKAQAHMRDLTQRLQMLLPQAVFNSSLDSNGFPILEVINNSENEWIYITTEYAAQSGAPVGSDPAGGSGPTPSNHVNGLNLPQEIYSPHMCQIYREASATPPADQNGRNQIQSQASLMGMKILIWEGAGVKSTTSLSAAQAAATTLVSSVPSDYINPLTQSQ